MKKVIGIIACISIFILAGCSKESCLKKYHFDSEAEFCKTYTDTKDKDLAIKLHNIGKECGCKCLIQ
jgi:hypothetical protein